MTSSFPHQTILRSTTMACILILCTILAVYAEIILRTSIVYTHLFYLPIVLGGLWYYRKVIAISLYLCGVHIGTQFLAKQGIEAAVILRAASFMAVALVVSIIAEHMKHEDRLLLDYMTSYSRRVTPIMERFSGTFDGIRMILGLNMDIERMKQLRDTDGLVQALRHQSAEVRYQAAWALGILRDPRGVDALGKALEDSDLGVKWKAAEALGSMGDSAVRTLSAAARCGDDEIRWRATLALGDTGAIDAILPLIGVLGDRDRYVQDRAVIALERFGEQAIGPLAGALFGDDPAIRIGAARALGYMGTVHAIRYVLAALNSNEEMIRSAAIQGLRDTANQAMAPLGELLGEERPATRRDAARALGILQNPKAMVLLHQAISDPDPEVRRSVMEALASVASAGKVQPYEER